ncbi:13245_t:CDS:2 [Cetraspora pellucida]|uniref:13245_t:CDS:1 n=1 Tax=Cetraspora pellucida TaxID=1433469 RepID=A0ACA9K838_9GLOM|nr:13245_t:CDS:2 [Cetraspora pellucida]
MIGCGFHPFEYLVNIFDYVYTILVVDYSELEAYLKLSGVKSFNYSQFSEIEIIGRGGSAVVSSAIFQEKKYALKSVNNNLWLDEKKFKQIKRELENLYKVGHSNHSNIIEFYGISRNSDNFMLVLQFANGGNLRDHLQRKQQDSVYKISWIELTQVAKEITRGIIHLHTKGIIHRDLHSKNILMNNGKALISDFGISKQLNDTTKSSSNLSGMIEYTDPRYLQCKVCRDKTSDIYSLGVLLWELTSGIPPFHGLNFMTKIIQISQNKREKIIANTPSDYANLIEKCWSSDPDQRPALDQILIQIENLSKEKSFEFIINRDAKNNQQIAKSELNYVDSSDFLNSKTENIINTCKCHEDNQGKSNGDNLGNCDDSENNAHSKDDTANDLNEPVEMVFNHKLVDLNEGMLLFTSSNYGSKKMIQIPIETIDELWDFFITYFLNTGLLWVFQPHPRDLVGSCERCGGIWQEDD